MHVFCLYEYKNPIKFGPVLFIYLFIYLSMCGSFNDAVNNTEHVPSNFNISYVKQIGKTLEGIGLCLI
jgi:hypothetical protein